MPGARITFDDAEWRAFFNKHRDKDWSSMLKAVFSTIGHKNIVQHFRDEKGEEASWTKRSAETQYRYSKIFNGEWKTPRGFARAAFNPSNKVLQQTGKLVGSILPTNTNRISKTAVRVFSNADYSGAHDRGTKHLPKRDFMWLDDNAKELMLTGIMRLAFD